MPEMSKLTLNADRLFPSDPVIRAHARELYEKVKDLPIISPHGHTDPSWFANDTPFDNATQLLVSRDHYVFRMLYSLGVSMQDMGIKTRDGAPYETDPRKIWHIFAKYWYAFRGTPSRGWLEHAFSTVLGVEDRLSPETADKIYDQINETLAKPEFRPRALYERFNIGALSTTDSPLSDLADHKAIKASGWKGRVVPAFRPDDVVDPEAYPEFYENLAKLGEVSGEDVYSWKGYLNAFRKRRAYFKENGCTSTDHGHPSALTADLSEAECEALFAKITGKTYTHEDAELFRAQILTEMAKMSIDDGLVMQIHPGACRNHNDFVFQRFGRDMGADIPVSMDYTHALKPLLNKFGNDRRLTLIVFTLDETVFSRELAPLAGHYPAMRMGPAWWFLDSPEAMMRYRETVTETGGFYNTVGFNDDTRAFLSIPARHDVARRIDCGYLGRLVAEHRLPMEEAHEVAYALTNGLVKDAYNL